VLGDDVTALIDQRFRGVAFLARIVPGIDHDEFQPRGGVDAAHAEQEGVHALDDFRNRN